MDLESWNYIVGGGGLRDKSITSPTKLNPGSWGHQEAGYPESWDEPPPQTWVWEAGIWWERSRKLGVWVVAAPRKLDVPVNYLFRRQKRQSLAGFNYMESMEVVAYSNGRS